jgi:1,4-dihydroxy-2-naphthoyl-CoA hydrolase
MDYHWEYRVQLRDTDAAGVLYFANLLALCHGAYEAALGDHGIDLRDFVTNPPIAIPIVQTSADFRRPIYCGDRLQIVLTATQQDDSGFVVDYKVFQDSDKILATAQTRHVAIDTQTRKRVALPAAIAAWLQTF